MRVFKIIEFLDSEWSEIIKRCGVYDFYHTKSYHNLVKEGRSVLVVADFGVDLIALPLVIRSIPNTDYFDCTSVYGYCGPLANKGIEDFDVREIAFFRENLQLFFEKNNIISVFNRLHPFIIYDKLFEDFGSIKIINETVYIDLKKSPEEQINQYRVSVKNEISQLKNSGMQVVQATSQEEIDCFVEIYHETMKRVGASREYYFDKEYFYNFFENNCFDKVLLLAKKDNEIMAGAIFTITKDFMQYHLAGSKTNSNRLASAKLILDEARVLGNDLGLSFLHLGGGVGAAKDSLFSFKAGFSSERMNFRVWKYIVNEKIYRGLSKKKDLQSVYFPLYRLPS